MELIEISIQNLVNRGNLSRALAVFQKGQVKLTISFLVFSHLPLQEIEIVAKEQIKLMAYEK